MAKATSLRRLYLALSGLVLLAILAVACCCALAPSPDMKSIPWLPLGVARWADTEPTFRNFPAFAAFGFFAALFSFVWMRSVSAAWAFYSMFLVALFSVGLELLQLMIPARCFDRSDIAWSITGAFAGSVSAFFLCLLFVEIFSRRA